MSTKNKRDPTICTDPIDATVLADYWLAGLPASEEEAVEEHLLSCDSCGSRLREVIALAEGIRQIAREGSLRMIVSEEFLKRAAEEGLRVRQYAPPAGGKVDCTVTAEDDFLIGRLAANLSGAKRVDLAICDERGVEQIRLPDIPANPDATSVVYQESITYAKGAPTSKIIARLITIDEAGAEHVLGEYTFNHTRTIPGPAARS
ncbi:MAG: zf-HC2 domain-containing protein [Acidobacteriota bacterium]|nr:zf-HC2 domain-containing protein [Acidobacteriota bacterium]